MSRVSDLDDWYHTTMGDLVNYSVETDEVVLLIFRDGTRMRVPTNRLEQYLRPRDAARVGSAVKLRHVFLRHHMPKVAVALAAGGMIAMFTFATKPLATLWVGDARSAAETPEPSATRIVQEPNSPTTVTGQSRRIGQVQPVATSRPAATPKPTVKPTPKPSLVKSLVHTVQQVTNILPQTTPLPTPQLLPTPEPSVSPAPSPQPSVLPTPQATPGPIAIDPNPTPQPGAGQVLGDSTSPVNQSTPIPKS